MDTTKYALIQVNLRTGILSETTNLYPDTTVYLGGSIGICITPSIT